jgi:hypothetical protein
MHSTSTWDPNDSGAKEYYPWQEIPKQCGGDMEGFVSGMAELGYGLDRDKELRKMEGDHTKIKKDNVLPKKVLNPETNYDKVNTDGDREYQQNFVEIKPESANGYALVEGAGLAGNFSVNGYFYVSLSNGTWYATVDLWGASEADVTSWQGSVQLYADNQFITFFSLSKNLGYYSIQPQDSKVRGSFIGEAVFPLPGNSNNVSIKIGVWNNINHYPNNVYYSSTWKLP